MASRRGIIERLVGRARGVPSSPTRSGSPTPTVPTMGEEVITTNVAKSPPTRLEPIPPGLEATAGSALRIDLLDDRPEGVGDDRDAWGRLVRETLTLMEPAERSAWLPVLAQAATATGARPSAKWLKVTQECTALVGGGAFTRVVTTWLDYYAAPPRNTPGIGDTPAPELSGTAERNITILRGLVWCCADLDDVEIARAVGAATEASFKKIPGVGARSIKIGNAGIYALSAMPGMHGTVQLARLRQRVVDPRAQKAMDSALDAAAARLGLAREDLDDLATPTFDLVDGRRRFEFPPFAAELIAAGAAEVEVRWLGPDGSVRRSEPAEIKRRYPEERIALKRSADDLRKTLLAQRDRIERFWLTERSWPLADWRERYLDHPLLAVLSRRLIWRFEPTDGRTSAPGTTARSSTSTTGRSTG